MISTRLHLVALSLLLIATGCGGPSAVNNELRKKNLTLQNQIDQLQRTHTADQQALAALQKHATTVPVLPENRLDKLYLPQALSIGRLTGSAKLDPQKDSDTGIKVYVVPTDQDAQPIKAAGSFDIEIFDLEIADHPLIAQAHFDTDQSRQNWFGSGFLYTYVLPIPLPELPRHQDLTVHITFHDELTGREIKAQKQIKLPLNLEPSK